MIPYILPRKNYSTSVTTETRTKAVPTFWFSCFNRPMRFVHLFKRIGDSWVYPPPETTLSFFRQRALDPSIGCYDISLQNIYMSEKVSATGSVWVPRLGFRSLVKEWKGREEQRGHLLWPRQGINKQTGCQAISTRSEQTGSLTNLPHIYGTKPGITQVRKVRCWNNTQVVLMWLWSKSVQSNPHDKLLFSR